MKKYKRLWILLIVIVFILNTRLVIQPEYDHYVIGSHIPDINLVFTGPSTDTEYKEGESVCLRSIWIGDRLFIETDYGDFY